MELMVAIWDEDYCRFLVKEAVKQIDVKMLWEVSLSIDGVYQDEDVDSFMSLYRKLVVKYCGIQEGGE